MKKTLIAFVVSMFVFGMAGTAMALPFPYSDIVLPIVYLNQGGSAYTHTFDLDVDNLLLGDINKEDTILASTLKLHFWDDSGWLIFPDSGNEYAFVSYDGLGPFTPSEVGRDLLLPGYTANVLASVLSDHKLELTVSSKQGDFYLSVARLEGLYSDNPSPVPEPTSMMLLGMGILGLFGLRKKVA